MRFDWFKEITVAVVANSYKEFLYHLKSKRSDSCFITSENYEINLEKGLFVNYIYVPQIQINIEHLLQGHQLNNYYLLDGVELGYHALSYIKSRVRPQQSPLYRLIPLKDNKYPKLIPLGLQAKLTDFKNITDTLEGFTLSPEEITLFNVLYGINLRDYQNTGEPNGHKT